MTTWAVTVLGHDRPGIIAETTAALANLGGNIEDSSMTLLRGHFAMTLVVSATASIDQMRDALGPVADDDLIITVLPLSQEADGTAGETTPYLLTLHAGDQPGIVSDLTRVVANAGGNITDLTTRLSGDLYVLAAELDLPVEVDATMLQRELDAAAARLGGGRAVLRPVESDEL